MDLQGPHNSSKQKRILVKALEWLRAKQALRSKDEQVQCLPLHKISAPSSVWQLQIYFVPVPSTSLPLYSLPLYPLLSPPFSPLSSNSAQGYKSPFCCFSGLALLVSPPLFSSSSSFRLTAGARPRLTFVISNPAGSAHKKSVVNSLSDLIPPVLFWWHSPLPSSPLFSLHYLSFRLLGGHFTSLIAT